ncbi:MAG: hypothetical protein ACREO5_01630 [Candidatus Binatia bacterium]
MFKHLTASIFVLLSSAAVFAQTSEPCTLKLSQAPALQGVKLGMSAARVGEILGGPIATQMVRTDAIFLRSGNDYVRSYSYPSDQSQLEEWNRNKRTLILGNAVSSGPNPRPQSISPNVDYMTLEFFQDSLESMTFRYPFSNMPWDGLPEFIQNISAKNRLPLSAWEYSTQPNVRSRASLNCGGFQLIVDGAPDGVYFVVDLKDTKARDDLTKVAKQKWLEQKAAEAKLKKEFVL